MKKIYSFILSAMMLIPAFAVAQSVDYCAPTGVDGRSSGENQTSATGRCLTVINVTDGTNSVAVQGAPAPTGGSRAIVYDRTSTVLSTSAGKTITMKSVGEGSWMNTFVYIDWGLDGLTTADRVFSNFNANVGMPYGDVTVTTNVPAGQAPGDYRVRYIIDWENTDPCHYGQASEGWSKPNDNGEYVIDFTIRVESEDYDVARTITVASANAAHGSVAITNPATDGNSISTTQKAVTMVATPAEGYSFLNWTDAAGNVVSTNASYTYTGAEDASFTANFGFALTYTIGENGSLEVYVGEELITSGTVVAPGAEVSVKAIPATGKFAQLTVNGAPVNLTNNLYTFTMQAATSLAVTFVDAIYYLTVEVIGDGEVKIMDGGSLNVGPSGNEYETGDNITGKTLRLFAKPADGCELISVKFQDEGSAATTLSTREVTAADYQGWYFAGMSKPTGNRTVTVEFTSAQAEVEYCQPEPVAGRIVADGKTKRTDRYLSSINLSDGENTATVEGTGYSWNRDVYADRTSTAFTTTAGKTVAVSASGAGEWMNTYVFVDFDLNGFTAEDKVFSNYEGQEPAPDNTVEQTFSFDVPATVEPGDYRVRYILDWWNQNNPCVYGQEGSDNGEAVIDFIITVADSTSGIGSIGIDPANGPVEYYNLQGVRVAAENLAPGFYVVRQGDKVAKVLIKK